MKIKQEFGDLIKSGEKNILLGKINSFEKHIDGPNYKSRIEIFHFINCIKLNNIFEHCSGCPIITINGYEIIKNPFKDTDIEFNDDDRIYYIVRDYFELNEISGIRNNGNGLVDYFKDEEEILVLKIESGEE